MCLGIPMKVLKIENDMAIVSAGQIRRRSAINMLDSVNLGDYVIVHAGFAIEKLDPQKAEETLRMLEEIQ